MNGGHLLPASLFANRISAPAGCATLLPSLPAGRSAPAHYDTFCAVATLGVEVHPLDFHTNLGLLRFNVWDTAGQVCLHLSTCCAASSLLWLYALTVGSLFEQEKFGGLRDGY